MSQLAGGHQNFSCLEAVRMVRIQWLQRQSYPGSLSNFLDQMVIVTVPHYQCLYVLELLRVEQERKMSGTAGCMNLEQGHQLARSHANAILGRPLWHQDLFFYLVFGMFLQISLFISLFECDLPASGWEIGSVCFQCFQEETELDSGTSCVPVGGSPVQSHTQTLWGQPPGVQGRGVEEELAPSSGTQVHTPTHLLPLPSSPRPLSGPHPSEVTEEGTAEGCPSLVLQIRKLGPTVYCPRSHCWSSASLSRFPLYRVPRSQPDTSVLHTCSQVLHNLLLNQNQSLLP